MFLTFNARESTRVAFCRLPRPKKRGTRATTGVKISLVLALAHDVCFKISREEVLHCTEAAEHPRDGDFRKACLTYYEVYANQAGVILNLRRVSHETRQNILAFTSYSLKDDDTGFTHVFGPNVVFTTRPRHLSVMPLCRARLSLYIHSQARTTQKAIRLSSTSG